MNGRTIVIAGWYTVDPSRRDEVVEHYRDLVRRARNAPGCLDFAISADPIDRSRINNCEYWESEEALNSWRSTAHPPDQITPILEIYIQKHVIEESGPPF
jgi:quinol monooxygenase YgiN